MQFKGYAGKNLRVNLTTGDVSFEPLTEEKVRTFLGANGFAADILYNELEPGIDPFSPDNKFIVAAGPLCGTLIPCAGKVYVASKSPLTGYYFDSCAGGFFSAELKRAGFDTVIVEGKAEEPVYIFIKDNKVEIKKADHLWGSTTEDFEDKVREELDEPKARMVCIGPAGENLVRYAGVFTDLHAAGRGGLGAVMGSKNLKGIVASGTQDIKVAATWKEFKEWYKENIADKFPGSTLDKGYSQKGTTLIPNNFQKWGCLGTRNWQEEQFDGADGLMLEVIKELEQKRISCSGCMAHCIGTFKVPDGPFKALSEGPEYETEYALGSALGNGNIKSIIKMDSLCDQLGLDTISTGLTIAWAVECFEKGILTEKDTGGIKLDWGDPETYIKLIHMIVNREGFGDLLAEGSKRAANKIGKNSIYYSVQSRGLEHPGHSTRVTHGMACGYAVSTRGGHHHDGRDFEYHASPKLDYDGNMTSSKGKGYMQGKLTRWTAFADAAGYCHFFEKFAGNIIDKIHADEVKLITGMDFTIDELKEIGARIWTLERAFNCREGVRRENDVVPERFMKEPVPSGPQKGAILTREGLEMMKDEFYESHGWDKETGVPTLETWLALGFDKERYAF
jgi:aldehyde:ferredoxin oxidoreductase